MSAKWSSMPRRSAAREQTVMSALYVSTVGATWSARMRCSTASASER